MEVAVVAGLHSLELKEDMKAVWWNSIFSVSEVEIGFLHGRI